MAILLFFLPQFVWILSKSFFRNFFIFGWWQRFQTKKPFWNSQTYTSSKWGKEPTRCVGQSSYRQREQKDASTHQYPSRRALCKQVLACDKVCNLWSYTFLLTMSQLFTCGLKSKETISFFPSNFCNVCLRFWAVSFLFQKHLFFRSPRSFLCFKIDIT